MINTQNIYAVNSEDIPPTTTENKDHLRKMFIGGLSAVTTEDSLRAFFSQWGDVVDAIVMRDPATKRSRGFGFISYSDTTMVDKAQNARPHVIDGKAVDSKRALPRPEGGKNDNGSSVKKIFVGGLKENHDEQCLSEHFSQFGNVVSVRILTDKTTGRKRGFAFVEFDDYDAVDKAVLHKNHTIKYVLVDVKKSVYKQELAKKLASQQQNGLMMPGANGQNVSGAPGVPNAYQQPMASYNPQATAYSYPPSVAPTAAAPAGAYNGWGGYYQHPMTAGYGSYGAGPQNGGTWNATAYTPAPTAWQNGYGTPSATPSPLTAVSPANVPANGWNGASNSVQQSFGDYQQSYNGGPQKAGSLQGNRMNPYQVSPATNYATSPGYVNIYSSQNNVSIPTTAVTTIPQPQSAATALSVATKSLTTPANKQSRRPY